MSQSYLNLPADWGMGPILFKGLRKLYEQVLLVNQHILLCRLVVQFMGQPQTKPNQKKKRKKVPIPSLHRLLTAKSLRQTQLLPVRNQSRWCRRWMFTSFSTAGAATAIFAVCIPRMSSEALGQDAFQQ